MAAFEGTQSLALGSSPFGPTFLNSIKPKQIHLLGLRVLNIDPRLSTAMYISQPTRAATMTPIEPSGPTVSGSPSGDSTEPSDGVLFGLLCGGDLDALDVIYGRYSTPVFRLALRILGSQEEAADLTHEVFLRLWKKQGYDPERGSMLVFLMTVTRSQALNRIRSAKSRRRLTERLGRGAVMEQSSLLESISTEEMSERVRNALHHLPSNQREVLELAYYGGLSQSEITQRLDIPLGTVKSRSRQGLLKLRKLLKDLVD